MSSIDRCLARGVLAVLIAQIFCVACGNLSAPPIPEIPSVRAITTDRPPGYFGAAMAYDSARDRAVLFGGGEFVDRDPKNIEVTGETWEFDGTRWSKIADTGPRDRYGAGMVYDSARERTVLFGGLGHCGDAMEKMLQCCGDTWEWDGTSWREISSASAIGARAFPKMVFDSARSLAVVYGGYLCGEHEDSLLRDLWSWNGADWMREWPLAEEMP